MINTHAQLKAMIDTRFDDKIAFTNDFFENWHLKRGMKEDEHFKVVDRATWDILFHQYGGNAVPRISVAVQTEDPLRPDYIVEIQHRTFEIATFPKVKYCPEYIENVHARVSRADTVKEVLAKLCESATFLKGTRKKARTTELQELCRLWKFEGQDTLADCQ